MTVIVLIVLVSAFSLGFSANELRIGGLFEEEDENDRLAFQLATTIINQASEEPYYRISPVMGRAFKFNTLLASHAVCTMLQDGIVGLIGPKSSHLSPYVKSLSDVKDIPLIEIHWDNNLKKNNYLVNLYPYPLELARSFVDIVKAWEWQSFTILYENDDSLSRITDLLTMYNSTEHTVTLRQLNAKGNHRSILLEVKRSGEKHYVVDSSLDTLEEVLQQAQQVGIMTEEQHYLILNLDMSTVDLSPYQYGGSNITGVRLINPERADIMDFAERIQELRVKMGLNRQAMGAVSAWKLKTQTALMFDAVRLLHETIKELRVSKFDVSRLFCNNTDSWEKGSSIINYMKAKTLEGITGTIKFDIETGVRKDFTLEIVELTPGGLTTVGTWNSLNGINMSRVYVVEEVDPIDENPLRNKIFTVITALFSNPIFEGERQRALQISEEDLRVNKALETRVQQPSAYYESSRTSQPPSAARPPSPASGNQRHHLRAASVHVVQNFYKTEPYGMLKNVSTTLSGNGRFEGFGIDIIHELSKKLDFQYKFILQEDGLYGTYNRRTRKWNGMLGEIIEGRADFAITDLTITSERESAVDFTMPFMNLGISMLYRKPEPEPPSLFTFAFPFSAEVWLLMAVSYTLVSLSFFVMGRLSPSEWINPNPCLEEPDYLYNQFSFRNSLWFTVGSLMQQGSEIAPLGISTRMAAGVWYFFILIMVSSYTANLAAFLTVEELVTPFETVEQLAAQEEILYGSKAIGATRNFFRDSNYSVYPQISQYFEDHPNNMKQSNDEGVDKAEKENYAFFMESTSIEYVTERHCNLTQVGGALDEKGYGIAMQKDSKYRHFLSTAILELQESGKLAELKTKWWKEKRGGGQCEKRLPVATPLDLQNLGGVFFVLGVGTLFGVIGTFIEMSWHTYTKSKKKQLSFKREVSRELKFFMKFKRMAKEIHSQERMTANSGQKNNSEENLQEQRKS